MRRPALREGIYCSGEHTKLWRWLPSMPAMRKRTRYSRCASGPASGRPPTLPLGPPKWISLLPLLSPRSCPQCSETFCGPRRTARVLRALERFHALTCAEAGDSALSTTSSISFALYSPVCLPRSISLSPISFSRWIRDLDFASARRHSSTGLDTANARPEDSMARSAAAWTWVRNAAARPIVCQTGCSARCFR